MHEKWFMIELLENVVLSEQSATDGEHRCLDYLPGSTFLGVAADTLFKDFGAKLFLSGRLRFSPALPLTEDNEIAFSMPLSFHKLKGADIYRPINGLTLPEEAARLTAEGRQPEQMRHDAISVAGQLHKVSKGRALKSATDRHRFGSARKRQLFSYEYLERGQRFAMRMQADAEVDKNTFEVVAASLCRPEGIRLGRSRSAEFSEVILTPLDTSPYTDCSEAMSGDFCSFYLASDLALFSEGCPALQPRPEDFGLPDMCDFLPERSFLRFRSYSPWNFFHNRRDLERQVILRGSVISFSITAAPKDDLLQRCKAHVAPGVGGYRQDGLGWVICNPSFVVNPPSLRERRDDRGYNPVPGHLPDTPLIAMITRNRDQEVLDILSLDLGRKQAQAWWWLHVQLRQRQLRPPGKSQWGAIRDLAVKAGNDLDRLARLTDDFCHDARRKKWWEESKKIGGVVRSMAKELEKLLASASPELARSHGLTDAALYQPFFVRIFYHAAAEMQRKFDRP